MTIHRNVTPTPLTYTRAIEVRKNWRDAGLQPRLIPYGKKMSRFLQFERARVGVRPEAVSL